MSRYSQTLIAVRLDDPAAQSRATATVRSGPWTTVGEGAPAVAVISRIADGQQFLRVYPNCLLVFVAQNGSEQSAVEALRAGCCDYLRQEDIEQQLGAALERALGIAQPALINGGEMLGSSAAMDSAKQYIRRAAATNSNVLVTGETGTGKEVAAKLIHVNSRRSRGPLVCINCAALPDNLLESELFGYERGTFTGAYASRDGKFQQASGGTIFLDEIGDMSGYAQAKILRVIESREVQRLGARHGTPVDIRIVAATNRDLESLIRDDRFRKDLFFRLNVARVHLPPLREHKDDIPLLVANFVREMNVVFERHMDGVTDRAMKWLLAHDWPGNVRELRNTIEAWFVNLPPHRVRLLDLPQELATPIDGKASERDRLLQLLAATRWNKSETARRLKWSRVKLYRKLAQYQLGARKTLAAG
jgi:DNA-binding NtrC family response regulator